MKKKTDLMEEKRIKRLSLKAKNAKSEREFVKIIQEIFCGKEK